MAVSMIGRTGVLVTCLIFGLTACRAQAWEVTAPDFTGIRISGSLRGGVPAIVQGQQLWFVLDGFHAQPRDLRVEVVHCDMDWRPTRSEFVNDPYLMRGKKPLGSSAAAPGIRSYCHRLCALFFDLLCYAPVGDIPVDLGDPCERNWTE